MLSIIKELGKDLLLEESIRVQCPFCNGGSHGEKSLNIKRVASGLVYHCFRASCPRRSGLVGSVYKPNKELETPRKDTGPKRFTGSLVELPEDIYRERFGRYQLSYEVIKEQGIKYAPDISRVYMPLYDYRGYQFAENLRSIQLAQVPKVLFNKIEEVPLLHFPLGQPIKQMVCITEDQTSSIKIKEVLKAGSVKATAASICGTNISDDCLMLLKRIGIKDIILMLDGDYAGRSATIKNASRLSPFFNTKTIFLPANKDPKDLSFNELGVLLA